MTVKLGKDEKMKNTKEPKTEMVTINADYYRELWDCVNEFCNRVELGEVRSSKTYARFCKAVGRKNMQYEFMEEQLCHE